MRRRLILHLGALGAASLATAACSSSSGGAKNPELAPRGTTVTTVKPTRQDLSNRVSLSGKVTVDPIFGVVAPVAGQIRYLTVATPTSTPTKPTKVATVKSSDGKSHDVTVPAGAVFTGRLVDDRSTVTTGLPIVSAKQVGYGVTADIDGAQAYQIADGGGTIQAQVKNGPGPFTCTQLGTIAALPAGTVPADTTSAAPAASGAAAVVNNPNSQSTGSDATGMRLVCVAPADVRLINGATVTVSVVTASATNVLTLPVEAVAGSQGKGQVDVVGLDGTRKTTDVVLGITDGKFIEIKSGLTGDETIAVPGPNLATPAANSNGNGPVVGPS